MITRFKSLPLLVFALLWSCAVLAQGSLPLVQTGSLPATANLVFEGDSITLGLLCNAPLNYPTRSILQLPAGPTYTNNTIATSGISSLTLDQNYATRAGTAFNAGSSLNMLMFMAGTNTSGATDTTAGQKYWWNRDYLRKAKNTGYQRIIVGTDLANGAGGANVLSVLGPLNIFQRSYYNSDMQADGLMDWGNSQFFWPAIAALNQTIYNTDFLHPIPLGCQQMANIAAPVMGASLQVASAHPFAPPTWSPFNNNAVGVNNGFDGAVALSADLRTASVPTGTANYTIRSLPGARTGTIYLEADVTGGAGIGIANDTFSYGNAALPGFDAGGNGIWWGNDGKIYFKSVGTLLTSTYASGDNLGMAINFGTTQLWTRRCRSGACQNWNNTAGCVPGNAGCAISFSGVLLGGAADRYYPTGGVITGADAIFSRFAASQLLNAIPSSFSTFGP